MTDDRSQDLAERWLNFTPQKVDIDYINNYLFDQEIPLSDTEIIHILVEENIRKEHEEKIKKQRGNSAVFRPADRYNVGDNLAFPTLNWKKGKVFHTRPGVNPTLGKFEVVEIEFEDGSRREFASDLQEHKLNQNDLIEADEDSTSTEVVMKNFGEQLAVSITKGLREDNSLVQIAGRWFPRALLIDMNIGHLNLAEAILDEAAGEPISTAGIIEQIGLPGTDNPNLVEFSMNYALQEDDRFDEVGPAGEVLWCLKRLEPADVQKIPTPLRYTKIMYDRSLLSKDMLALESVIDDELGEAEPTKNNETEVTICLSYPHWRAGTLPVSMRTRKLFPTAYESERVRFHLVDGVSKAEMPAWIVRRHGYVAGLKEYYQKYGVIPGSLVKLRPGEKPGQVFIEARTRRPIRDWVRTVLVGSDGGIVFANLKQNLTTEVNERMVVAVPDVQGIDAACEQLAKQQAPFDQLVKKIMQELTKLNIQGHIHAQELYSAINIVRRCPLAPLLAHLAGSSIYKHVGDMHFRIVDAEAGNDGG